ncbi:hypothetical protein [Kluyvera intermedia]|uniref:hypothetical protein n=1 Tax=Kluyvera intermedia TaxID=61648 RepID=UPI00242D5ECA|nr:hypothetical protein [Kluyvera intermedia]WEJ86146.1 MAG: hypothetical protein P0Y47_08885 [Kluyvera intermedia]
MISELFSDTSTRIFVILIITVFIWAICLDKGGKRKRFVEYAPTLMTSLGILGTFFGVAMGLLKFDTGNIDRSIIYLLSGLKTGFVASIFGITATIIFNAQSAWRFKDNHDEEDTKQNEIYHSIIQQTELLRKIKTGLLDPADDSISGEIKQLRVDLNIHHREFDTALWKKFDEFSLNVSESAGEKIIDGLRSVVHDFNNNLFEQFGENFKALDASVKKLVEWQETYKTQLEILDSQFNNSTLAITDIATKLDSIQARCASIPQTMEAFQSLMLHNENQLRDLENNLEAFVLMRDQAIMAVPVLREGVESVSSIMLSSADNLQMLLEQAGQRILSNAERINLSAENNIEQINQSVQSGMASLDQMSMQLFKMSDNINSNLEKGAQKVSDEMLNGMRNMRAVMETATHKLSEEFTASNDKVRASIALNVQQLSDSLSSTNKQMMSSMENGYQNFNSMAGKSITAFNDTITQQRQKIEIITEQEITRELELMGKALLQISQGFVNNYDQLIKNYEEKMTQFESKLAPAETLA